MFKNIILQYHIIRFIWERAFMPLVLSDQFSLRQGTKAEEK
jgi:hypothetical protein